MWACEALTDEPGSPILSLGYPFCSSEVLQRPSIGLGCHQTGNLCCVKGHLSGLLALSSPIPLGSDGLRSQRPRLQGQLDTRGQKPRALHVGMGSLLGGFVERHTH